MRLVCLFAEGSRWGVNSGQRLAPKSNWFDDLRSRMDNFTCPHRGRPWLVHSVSPAAARPDHCIVTALIATSRTLSVSWPSEMGVTGRGRLTGRDANPIRVCGKIRRVQRELSWTFWCIEVCRSTTTRRHDGGTSSVKRHNESFSEARKVNRTQSTSPPSRTMRLMSFRFKIGRFRVNSDSFRPCEHGGIRAAARLETLRRIAR
jgi:hypothetical protein